MPGSSIKSPDFKILKLNKSDICLASTFQILYAPKQVKSDVKITKLKTFLKTLLNAYAAPSLEQDVKNVLQK